ncbi:hypothetical protein [uncultured Sphingomonas sp.]|uniref:hypothetical protein n=1 Tax=uncultured Sphingomonas sp. TaxID=158754 RepID=UPI0025E95EA4|nr:hypothetical protein [uncultured Sphingomonas sp.]
MKVLIGGASYDLGVTEAKPTVGIIDYSRRVTDDFGVTRVVPRDFARRMSVRMALPFDGVDALNQRLAVLRAQKATWQADERYAALAFDGFYKDFSIDLNVPPLSYCTLTVEGLAEPGPAVETVSDPAPDGKQSTLRLLQPVALSDATLTASNVPENDAAAWVASTAYAVGAKVIRGHRVYESLVASNYEDPSLAPTAWLDIGPTNRWAMFDQALGTATTRASSIVVSINTSINAIAALDVSASTIRVQAAGYDRTIAVVSGRPTLFLDMPAVSNATVTIAGSGTVTVGTLLVGNMTSLGITGASPTASISDFSRKEADDFGNVQIVERAWSKRMEAKALIRTDALDKVFGRLAAVRTRPSLWIGDSALDSLIIYGFFRDFSIEVDENVSTLSLSVEGLSLAAPPGVSIADQLAAIVDDVSSIDGRLGEISGDVSAVDARVDGIVADVEEIAKAVVLSVQNTAVVVASGSLDATGKGVIAQELAFATDRRKELVDRATPLRVSTAAVDADLAAFQSYVTGLPNWSSATLPTPVDPTTYNTLRGNLFATFASLESAISARIALGSRVAEVMVPGNSTIQIVGDEISRTGTAAGYMPVYSNRSTKGATTIRTRVLKDSALPVVVGLSQKAGGGVASIASIRAGFRVYRDAQGKRRVSIIVAGAEVGDWNNGETFDDDIALLLGYSEDGTAGRVIHQVGSSIAPNSRTLQGSLGDEFVYKALLVGGSIINGVVFTTTDSVPYDVVVNGPPKEATVGSNIVNPNTQVSGATPTADGWGYTFTGNNAKVYLVGGDGAPVSSNGAEYLNITIQTRADTGVGSAYVLVLPYTAGGASLQPQQVDARKGGGTVQLPIGTTKYIIVEGSDFTSGSIEMTRAVVVAAQYRDVDPSAIVGNASDDGVDLTYQWAFPNDGRAPSSQKPLPDPDSGTRVFYPGDADATVSSSLFNSKYVVVDNRAFGAGRITGYQNVPLSGGGTAKYPIVGPPSGAVTGTVVLTVKLSKGATSTIKTYTLYNGGAAVANGSETIEIARDANGVWQYDTIDATIHSTIAAGAGDFVGGSAPSITLRSRNKLADLDTTASAQVVGVSTVAPKLETLMSPPLGYTIIGYAVKETWKASAIGLTLDGSANRLFLVETVPSGSPYNGSIATTTQTAVDQTSGISWQRTGKANENGSPNAWGAWAKVLDTGAAKPKTTDVTDQAGVPQSDATMVTANGVSGATLSVVGGSGFVFGKTLKEASPTEGAKLESVQEGATADITFIYTGNQPVASFKVEGNSLTKVAGAATYSDSNGDSGVVAIPRNVVTGAARLVWGGLYVNQRALVGFVAGQNRYASEVRAGMKTEGDKVYAVVNGVQQEALAVFDGNSVFELVYSNVRFIWRVNGQTLKVVDASTGGTYWPHFHIATVGTQIARIGYGVYSDDAWASVGGEGKPDDGATAGDNLLINGSILKDTTGWTLDPGITRQPAQAGDPAPFFRSVSGNRIRQVRRPIPAGARRLYYSYVERVAEQYQQLALGFEYTTADFNYAGGAEPSTFQAVAGEWRAVKGFLDLPANAAYYTIAIAAIGTAAKPHDVALLRIGVTEVAATVGAQVGGGPAGNLLLETGQKATDAAIDTGKGIASAAHSVVGGGTFTYATSLMQGDPARAGKIDGVEAGSDVTLNNFPVIEDIEPIVVKVYRTTGQQLAGQYPITRKARLMVGGVDKSSQAQWVINTTEAAAATIDTASATSARGTITTTAVMASTVMTVSATYGGRELRRDVRVTVQQVDPPPSTAPSTFNFEDMVLPAGQNPARITPWIPVAVTSTGKVRLTAQIGYDVADYGLTNDQLNYTRAGLDVLYSTSADGSNPVSLFRATNGVNAAAYNYFDGSQQKVNAGFIQTAVDTPTFSAGATIYVALKFDWFANGGQFSPAKAVRGSFYGGPQ